MNSSMIAARDRLNDYPDLKGIETLHGESFMCDRLNDYPDLKGIETTICAVRGDCPTRSE